ncbi:MAG: hypothetical protein PWQ22_40 [Archaeoglobaceae archaeon]|nr:hypothetical protein [Archaeoglobaceae archaeon]
MKLVASFMKKKPILKMAFLITWNPPDMSIAYKRKEVRESLQNNKMVCGG